MCLNIQGYIQPSYPYLLYIFFRPFELENAVQSSPGPVIKPPEPLHQLQLHIQATSTSSSVGIPSQSHWQPVAGRQLAETFQFKLRTGVSPIPNQSLLRVRIQGGSELESECESQ